MIVQTLYPKPFINDRARNTDFRTYYELERLNDYFPVAFRRADSMGVVVPANLWCVLRAVLHRVPLAKRVIFTRVFVDLQRSVWVSNRLQCRGDVLYTNYNIPVNKPEVPLILESDFCTFGVKRRDVISRLLYTNPSMVAKCSRVLVRHPASLRAFQTQFPQYAERGVVMPYFLPNLREPDLARVALKWRSEGDMRVLFVGRQARRKGLVGLCQAISIVRERIPMTRIELTVVSDFEDGAVVLPPGTKWYRSLSQRELAPIFKDTHIFAMPTLEEAYGRVFVEALNYGCALLAPSWQPAGEIWNRFGSIVDVCSDLDIAAGLEALVRDRQKTEALAENNMEVFRSEYHPRVVARKYRDVFEQVAQRS